MPWPKHWIRAKGDWLCVGNERSGVAQPPDEFLQIFDETRSLAALRKKFPASRSGLIKALNHFGRDPIGVIAEQLKSGHSNEELARLHGVDAKWIAEIRQVAGIPPLRGRPSAKVSDAELVETVGRFRNNMSAVGRELGIDARTAALRWKKARHRNEQ